MSETRYGCLNIKATGVSKLFYGGWLLGERSYQLGSMRMSSTGQKLLPKEVDLLYPDERQTDLYLTEGIRSTVKPLRLRKQAQHGKSVWMAREYTLTSNSEALFRAGALWLGSLQTSVTNFLSTKQS
jgi:hypothetical protein